jgi:flavin-dependent dehydrogenase
MGLFEAFLAEGHLACYGNRVIWGDCTATETDFLRDPDGNGWHLDRYRFDAWLRRTAIKRGAMLAMPAQVAVIDYGRNRWNVQLSTDGGPVALTAGFVIDCGGRVAPVARRFAKRRHQAADRLTCAWVHGGAQSRGRGVGLSTIEAVEDGWWYTAPIPGQRRVLAFFTDAGRAAARLAHNPHELIAKAATTLDIAPLLDESNFVPLHGGLDAAHYSALERRAGPGWMAAGDAGISFDPISGQGLLHALFTGLAAADAADRYLSGAIRALDDYQRLSEGIESAYHRHLAHCYVAETRWRAAPFWQHRVRRFSRLQYEVAATEFIVR